MFRSDERGAYSPLQFLLIDLAGNRPLIQNELFDSIIWEEYASYLKLPTKVKF